MKLEVPEDKRLMHTMRTPIRWGDMDAMGHELLRTDDPSGTVYANGGATLVWLDFPKQKSLPMPEGLRDWLTGD